MLSIRVLQVAQSGKKWRDEDNGPQGYSSSMRVLGSAHCEESFLKVPDSQGGHGRLLRGEAVAVPGAS